ncbi:MAG: class A beta-lactamase-related serine hydrolase [Candidatus Eremiobacteraeota bacterium]|nr:class A beta-lactamase-related serine hydrolase [Candidatus Eremiobacteraeota bacterium]
MMAAALVLSLSQSAWAAEDAVLDAQMGALASEHQGKVALYATDVRSGKTASIDADRPVPTASVIKLAVLFEALKQIQSGRVHFEDKLTLLKDDQVEGSGVFALFDTPLALTLKDALTMMVVVSDNSGTNLAIDHLGLENIDKRIQWMGLHDTWLYKKVFKPVVGVPPADQKQFGLGKTTAREMAAIMQRFATCDLNEAASNAKPSPSDQKLCDDALGMLKSQTDRDSIPRYLTDDVANKTGALDAVRNDVAIVFARNGPVIISEFTYDNKDQTWTPDNTAQLLMAKLAKAIVDRWQ